jgi:hypothetical protein
MSAWPHVTSLLLLLGWPMVGFGFGNRPHSAGVTTLYYYPAPVVVMPSYSVFPYSVGTAPLAPLCQPALPTNAQPALAAPTPAPPSAGPAVLPRTTQPAPSSGLGIKGIGSNYGAASGGVRPAPKPSGDRCSVGFWNLTDRDLILAVDGRSHIVPRGKNLLLDLKHQFAWKVEGREAQLERVRPSEAAMESVMRR